MKLIEGIKKNKLFIVAIALALVTTWFIYNSTRDDQQKNEVEKIEVLKAVIDIPSDMRITEDMVATTVVEKTPGAERSIKNIADVVGKYADTKILQNEVIRKERLRQDENDVSGTDEREYRIEVSPVSYGGVIPGSHADILWYGSVGPENTQIGGIVYENVEVVKVLNEYEEDVYSIEKDKYNKQNTKVNIVVLSVSQEQAAVLDLLRALTGKEKAFTLIKYTERSEPKGIDKQFFDISQIYQVDQSEEQQETTQPDQPENTLPEEGLNTGEIVR